MLLKEGAFVATFIYALYFVTVSKCSTTNNQVLLVISLDGFRYDYFNRGLTPTLEILRRCGSYAPYMRPVFPTKTFVNHFSIATGLYAGTHGVLGNELYDAEQGHVIYSNDLFSQNKDVMPIWAWNEMRGGRSGCMMWPGSNFAYQGHKCTYTQPFDENISREDQLDKIISWILDPTVPANLIMMYVNQPDDASHAYGPYADKVCFIHSSVYFFLHSFINSFITDSFLLLQQNEMLRKVDNMFALLLKYLDDNNLGNRVNIIVLSDHGMSDVPVKHFIDLTQFLTPNTYKLDNTSPLMQIIPGPGYENEIFEKLSNAAENPKNHFKIYNNDTVPDRWRVRNKNRFGPILAVADPTYGFQDMVDLAKWFRDARDVPCKNYFYELQTYTKNKFLFLQLPMNRIMEIMDMIMMKKKCVQFSSDTVQFSTKDK